MSLQAPRSTRYVIDVIVPEATAWPRRGGRACRRRLRDPAHTLRGRGVGATRMSNVRAGTRQLTAQTGPRATTAFRRFAIPERRIKPNLARRRRSNGNARCAWLATTSKKSGKSTARALLRSRRIPPRVQFSDGNTVSAMPPPLVSAPRSIAARIRIVGARVTSEPARNALRVDKNDQAAMQITTAIQTGETARVKVLLEQHPDLATAIINDEKGAGRTLLHIATDWPGHFPNVGVTITCSRKPAPIPTPGSTIRPSMPARRRCTGPPHRMTWRPSTPCSTTVRISMPPAQCSPAAQRCPMR